MTDPQSPTHADFRRAAALVAHRAEGSVDGIRCVLNEAGELNRTTPLLTSVIDCFTHLTRELRTDEAIIAINESLAQCATLSHDTASRRGAEVILARHEKNVDAFNAVLIEANDDGRPVEVIAAVLDLYLVLLPELASAYALSSLAKWTARIAASENGIDGD